MMLRNSKLSCTVSLAVGLACASLYAQTETQTFDNPGSAEAAGWTFNDEGQNTERYREGEIEDNRCREDAPCETNLGWKDSNFAGGANSGEGGGLVHRSGGLPVGFYADTTIGELNLDMPITASGKVSLVNMNANGHYHFGFFDGQRILADDSESIATGCSAKHPVRSIRAIARRGAPFSKLRIQSRDDSVGVSLADMTAAVRIR